MQPNTHAYAQAHSLTHAFDQVQSLKLLFHKTIPNGKGGPTSASASALAGDSPRVQLSNKKAAEESRAEARFRMDCETHQLQVAKYKAESSSSTTPRQPLVSSCSKEIREAIRDCLLLRRDFLACDDADMVAHEDAIIVKLKARLEQIEVRLSP
jgi:hypothetical protein